MTPLLVSMSSTASGPDTTADIIIFWSLVGLCAIVTTLLAYTIWKTK